jgi:hypothetical protein
VGITASAVFATSASGADRVAAFNKVKGDLLRELRGRDPQQRVDAIGRLEKFAIDDSVKMIHGALADDAPEVRDAAYAALMRMNDKQEVCDTLMEQVRSGVRSGDPAGAAPTLAVVVASELRSTQEELDQLFHENKAALAAGTLLTYLADELGRHGKPDDVRALASMTNMALFEEHFGVRRAVVRALAEIPALSALIDVMPRISGEARADVVEHVTAVTGQIFAMDAAAWRRWWADAKSTFEYPVRSDLKVPDEALAESASSHYYGLPLFSERLVFVLDTSGSMSGERIVAAKRELVKAIEGLPEHAEFSVVVFNSTVGVWQRQLVPATRQTKQKAAAFVNAQQTGSHTASYDAIEAAFMFDTEAIYFLSDGAPTGGKIRAPGAIVEAVTAANRARRISIYTIGVGAGQPGGALDAFLKTLAEQNLGSYRRVDG